MTLTLGKMEKRKKKLTSLFSDIRLSAKEHSHTFLAGESALKKNLSSRLDCLIGELYLQIGTPIADNTKEAQYQLSLGASFIKTHYAIRPLVLDGHLIESYALIRKQLECVARLYELEITSIAKLKGKTPNIQNALGSEHKEFYQMLSRIAHFADSSIVQFLDSEKVGGKKEINIFSRYSSKSVQCDESRIFVGLFFCRWFIKKLGLWYPEANLDLWMAECGQLLKFSDWLEITKAE